MNILYIKSSVSGENSHSIKLGDYIVGKLKESYVGSEVVVKDLVKSPMPYYSEAHYRFLFLNEEPATEESVNIVKESDTAISEVENADVVVIGVPMYNFGIPATLKTWLDFLSRSQKTFRYTENGPEGLLKNKKVYLAISSGGVYTNADMKAFDFTESFLKTALNFLGMTDITVLRTEGVGIPGIKETAFEKAIADLVV